MGEAGSGEIMSATVAAVHQQITKLAETAGRIKEQRDEAYAVLRDIILGADMMLEPALQLSGTMRRYVEEVKRVALAGLQS